MTKEEKNSNKVKLWTRQDIKSLDDLRENGVIRIRRQHLEEKFEEISDYIIDLYDWFTREAAKRVPKPDGVDYFIWCSISEDNMLRPTSRTVVYELEVDESEVVYFDGTKWDQALNHIYIPKDKEDKKRYLEEIKKKGFDSPFQVMDEDMKHFYPLERQKVIDSRVRVFDIDEWDIYRVQANIWEIREDMVTDIIFHEE